MFVSNLFDNLFILGVKVKMSSAFNKDFERYTRIVNPKGGGEKVLAFDAHHLIKSLCHTCAHLYDTVATSLEEVLRDKSLLEQEIQKLSDSEDGRVKKLAGELVVCRQQLSAVYDTLKERGQQ